MEPAALPLAAWESFYVIVGSSAGALTGLQFVVLALAAEVNVLGDPQTTSAFSTPTVVHFSGVLLLSAVVSAPWRVLPWPAIALGISGLAGVIYTVTVMRAARRQTAYAPVLEDWLFHAALPLAAYVVVVAAAAWLPRQPEPALFALAAAALLLLFVGIHNAWDSVTFIGHRARGAAEKRESAE